MSGTSSTGPGSQEGKPYRPEPSPWTKDPPTGTGYFWAWAGESAVLVCVVGGDELVGTAKRPATELEVAELDDIYQDREPVPWVPVDRFLAVQEERYRRPGRKSRRWRGFWWGPEIPEPRPPEKETEPDG